MRRLTILLWTLASYTISAQQLTQNVRGTVVDRVSKAPIPGASVIVAGSNPLIGTTTDENGIFKLAKVTVGQHALRISFIGYKDVNLPGVIVNSGKEVVLSVQIEEDIARLEEVVITPDLEKNRPINEMSTVSARTFSVDETRKFAAAVNDPARAALSFAGVVSTDDGNNTISIRGNSPYGLLWRMEGVDIPNPNHFANAGTSGGGISILSSQLMTNSDFITGAFAAEYGNALAGVFDINLRKGNNEKREYTVQAGFLGLDIAAEGPFAKNYAGSYLINYRYSTLSVLSAVGFDVGDEVTNFQDLSYNIWLPTRRAGNFSLFGFGGLSSQVDEAEKDSTLWVDDFMRYQSTYFSNTGAAGLKHAVNFGDSYLQSSLVVSGNDHGYHEERLDDNYAAQPLYEQKYLNRKVTFSSVINHKFNARYHLRAGVYLNQYFYNLHEHDAAPDTLNNVEPLNANSQATTLQTFGQLNYKASPKLTFNAGAHFLYLANNRSASLEPRASLRYELTDKQALTFGYGLHSQMQTVGIYEAQVRQDDGTVTKPNQSIGFNKSHHIVAGYNRSVTKFLHVKTEVYYQRLFNIAVLNNMAFPLSTLGIEEGYLTRPLVNQGKGRNMGLELTLEQFMHRNMYFLFSGSLYDSKYTALDGVWRNTRFNGRGAMSLTGGKEWEWRKSRTFGVNIKAIFAGGFRITPVDLERSNAEGRPVYMLDQSYAEQLPAYFRTDLRISLKRNRPKSTSTIAIDVQNITNRENVGGRFYDPRAGAMREWYQLPLLPVLSYRVEF